MGDALPQEQNNGKNWFAYKSVRLNKGRVYEKVGHCISPRKHIRSTDWLYLDGPNDKNNCGSDLIDLSHKAVGQYEVGDYLVTKTKVYNLLKLN
jgi:hypothetical protein